MKTIGLTMLLVASLIFNSKPNNELMSATLKTDKIISVSVILNCSIDKAFDYFSKGKLLEQWLTVKANVTMEAGGDYDLFWTPEDPDLTNNSTYGCKILAVERPYYFNSEWKGNADQKQFMNKVRPLTNISVFFSKINNSKTKVTLLHTGWRQGQDWEQARLYFEKAWKGAFITLEKLVNK